MRPRDVRPRKRTFNSAAGMSALGQKRTHAPKQKGSLFDHLVGPPDERVGDIDAEDFKSGRRIR